MPICGDSVGRPRNDITRFDSTGRYVAAATNSVAMMMPIAPPMNVYTSASSTNGQMIQRAFAPRAIFTPISRVRSLITANMMLATPTPPMSRVSAPTMPRNIWIPPVIIRLIFALLTVSHVPKARSSVGS